MSGLEEGITVVNGTTPKPRPAPRPPRGATRDPTDWATASPPRGSEHRPQGGRAETRGADGGRTGGRGAGRGLVWRGRAGGWAGLFLTWNYPIYTLLKISLLSFPAISCLAQSSTSWVCWETCFLQCFFVYRWGDR